ncbi:MAG: hypothetical protein ABI231_00500 [Candidatus Tumulicola sp.]
MRSSIGRVVSVASLAVLVWFAFGYLSARPACAHDPRFVCSPRGMDRPVVIPDPAKSWAYYGGLSRGQHDVFVFTVTRPLQVPWNLLVDRRDVSNPARPVAILSGSGGVRVARLGLIGGKTFYEPFSRLTYLESTDLTLHLPPGRYEIDVGMDGGDRRQRYVMAIGAAERFNVGEIPYVLRAIRRIRSQSY